MLYDMRSLDSISCLAAAGRIIRATARIILMILSVYFYIINLSDIYN